MRETILVSVDVPGEAEAAEAWFAKWRPHLSYCSENTGCGCCVHIWDVDAPPEALAELPDALKAMSQWTHPEIPRRIEATQAARPVLHDEAEE
jgi:hypothetical protein